MLEYWYIERGLLTVGYEFLKLAKLHCPRGSCNFKSDAIQFYDLLGEVLVSIGHYGKAPADVIDWERHLIMGL